MKQNIVRRERNFPVRSKLKTLFKKELLLIKEGKTDEAVKHMPMVYSIIDVACKKKILHPNTADRKKSRLARALNDLQSGNKSAPVKAEVKKEVKEEKVEEAKVEEKAEAAAE